MNWDMAFRLAWLAVVAWIVAKLAWRELTRGQKD